ncbi:unnamed protein product [Candidula unifasciata]|uniref:Late endosomal/lysosomal adaptor and MAPK and MTOR activator 5 n=1 Tax=Candidula unifasciata TaxID=100452 RepID=A0A8S3ZW95_9EUPU|nr:unnamed protein product [Candidula unifasciata]
MEKALDKQMHDALHVSGASGIICVDNSGLCLGAKGTIPQQCSGSLYSLVSQAAELSQSPNVVNPVICLEAENGSVFVKKTDRLTTAVFKSS